MSFYKTFNKLCKVHDNTIVFRDWLDYSIDQFLINPDLKYFQHDKYNENEYKLFFELFKTWIKNMETHHQAENSSDNYFNTWKMLEQILNY